MSPFAGKTILVVDDEIGFLEIIGGEFTMEDARVFTSQSIAGAQEILLQEKIDLVISDMTLPDGAGTTLVSGLCTLECKPAFVLMSGDTKMPVEELKQLGCDAVFVKPFEMEDVLKVSESLIAMRKAL